MFGHEDLGCEPHLVREDHAAAPPPPPPPSGVRLFVATNCISEERPLEMWVEDVTAGTGWADMGQLQDAWVPGDGCMPTTDQTWTFVPTPGHTYLFKAVDFSAPGCSNDPLVSCWDSERTFAGDTNGTVETDPIG